MSSDTGKDLFTAGRIAKRISLRQVFVIVCLLHVAKNNGKNRLRRGLYLQLGSEMVKNMRLHNNGRVPQRWVYHRRTRVVPWSAKATDARITDTLYRFLS